jgi:hypothetical protein
MGDERSVFDFLRKAFLTFWDAISGVNAEYFWVVLGGCDRMFFGSMLSGGLYFDVVGCVVAGCVASLNAPYVG